MNRIEEACIALDLRIVADPKQLGHYKILNDRGKCVYQYWASKDMLMRTEDYMKFFGSSGPLELHRYKDERDAPQETPTMSCRLSADNAEGIGVPVVDVSEASGKCEVRERFEADLNVTRDYSKCLLVVVHQMATGAKEVTTHVSDIQDKIHYYLTRYDDQFRWKTCIDVRILGILLV